jgi:hypothetical protein
MQKGRTPNHVSRFHLKSIHFALLCVYKLFFQKLNLLMLQMLPIPHCIPFCLQLDGSRYGNLQDGGILAVVFAICGIDRIYELDRNLVDDLHMLKGLLHSLSFSLSIYLIFYSHLRQYAQSIWSDKIQYNDKKMTGCAIFVPYLLFLCSCHYCSKYSSES